MHHNQNFEYSIRAKPLQHNRQGINSILELVINSKIDYLKKSQIGIDKFLIGIGVSYKKIKSTN